MLNCVVRNSKILDKSFENLYKFVDSQNFTYSRRAILLTLKENYDILMLNFRELEVDVSALKENHYFAKQCRSEFKYTIAHIYALNIATLYT